MDLHKTAEGLSCSWAGVVTQGSLNSKLYHRTSCVSQHGHKWHFWWDISPYGTVLFIVGTFSTVSLSHQRAGEAPIIVEQDSKQVLLYFCQHPWMWRKGVGWCPLEESLCLEARKNISSLPPFPDVRSVLLCIGSTAVQGK